MKTVLKIVFFSMAMILSGSLMAQENAEQNNNLSNYYDSELFNWSYNMFNGLSLHYHNQSSSATFGVNKSMQNAFLRYPDSSEEYRTYKWKNLTGNIFMWGGMALVLSAFIPIFMDTNRDELSAHNANISLGLSLGGLVSTLVGSFFYSSSQENIFNAVNIFNRNKINEYRQ